MNKFVLTKILSPLLLSRVHKVCCVLDWGVQSFSDVGCSKEKPIRMTNRQNFLMVNADFLRQYIQVGKIKRYHDEYVLCDVRFLSLQ